MGRPYRYIGRHLKVKFIQSLDGVVSKMYHADRKMTNTSGVLQLPTPSASSSLSGVSPSSCSLCGVQTETSQSSCRELPGTNSAPASFWACWQVLRGPVPTPPGCLGRTPSWPPRGTLPQRHKAGPEQAEDSCRNGASGSGGCLVLCVSEAPNSICNPHTKKASA